MNESSDNFPAQIGTIQIESSPETEKHLIADYLPSTFGLSNVTLTNIWHYSNNEIAEFVAGKGSNMVARYGEGTYIGSGELAGDRVRELAQGSVRHDLSFTGNILFIEMEDAYDVPFILKELTGYEERKGFRGLNETLRSYGINGIRYDAFCFYTKDEDVKGGIEGVVLNPEKLKVIGIEEIK